MPMSSQPPRPPHTPIIPGSISRTTGPFSLLLSITEGRERCDSLHCAVCEGHRGKTCKTTKLKKTMTRLGFLSRPIVLSKALPLAWLEDKNKGRLMFLILFITIEKMMICCTDAEAETPILWPPDSKNWLIGKDPVLGKIEGGRRRGWQRMR